MNRSIKAVLLSALIYPGIGHVFLKKYVAGCILASIFSVPVFLVVSEVITKTNKVIEEIEKGNIPLDTAAITEALSNVMSSADIQSLNTQVYVMMVVWIIAIVDAYRVGKK